MTDQKEKAPVVGIFITFMRADGSTETEIVTVKS